MLKKLEVNTKPLIKFIRGASKNWMALNNFVRKLQEVRAESDYQLVFFLKTLHFEWDDFYMKTRVVGVGVWDQIPLHGGKLN